MTNERENEIRISVLREEVMEFAGVMEARLQIHEDKGSWEDISLDELFAAVVRQVFEMHELLVLTNQDRVNEGGVQDCCLNDIINKAADIGNYAMMMADNASGEMGG